MARILLIFILVFSSRAADIPAVAPVTYESFMTQAREAERKGSLDGAVDLIDKALALNTNASSAYQMRGVDNFKLGRIDKSIEDFNHYLALEPQQAPYHWQRGIALYYAGKFEEGRKQFELHQTVNPNDVENGVWHFLCVARLLGVEKARAAMLPISGDRRVPMTEVYELFTGKITVDDVLKAAKLGEPSPAELENRLFYAHLYLGLYYEAKGDARQAYEQIKLAATDHPSDDYMGDVARVHFKRLKTPK